MRQSLADDLEQMTMRLIGMLDSPYVRRAAISMRLLGLRFEHQSLSVFRTFAEFRAINPVVKAPTLVADDGTVLMESTLIIDYAETLARPRSLVPLDPPARLRDLRLTGLALAACEQLDGDLAGAPASVTRETLTQGLLSTAVAWHFTQRMIPDVVPYERFANVDALSAAAEDLADFRAAPHGGTEIRLEE
jgi:glutathione S-transferase